MDLLELSTTRRALHAVAELLIAGPQYDAAGDIRLAARQGGFGGWIESESSAMSGTELITPTGRFPLGGSVNDLAGRAGITPRALRDVYTGGPQFALGEPTDVSASAAEVLCQAFAHGDTALRILDPGQVPTLWPEHFDIGITMAEINYGVSPGDGRPVNWTPVHGWERTGADRRQHRRGWAHLQMIKRAPEAAPRTGSRARGCTR